MRNVGHGVVIAAWVLGITGCGGAASSVRVNQLGYLPGTSKVAVIETEATVAQPWELLDGDGEVVATGSTTVHGADAESGQNLHWADFSTHRATGEGFVLRVAGEDSPSFSIDPGVYRTLKYDALGYFYHHRVGVPIEAAYVPGEEWTRDAGHVSDREVPYKGGEREYTLDVSGGWYDAGDHGKYVVNAGIATWTLLHLYERAVHLGEGGADFGDGKLRIPEQGNGVPDLLDEARWEVEFLLRMQVPRGLPDAGMVHHKIHDGAWTPVPFMPPEETNTRYLHRPSTAATLNLAAVAAQAARIWKDLDPEFSERCLKASARAWNAARRHPDVFAPAHDSQGGGPYDDSEVGDEFYWAAAELSLSLDEAKREPLLAFLRRSPHHAGIPLQAGHEQVRHHTSMTWQTTGALGSLSLAVVPGGLPEDEVKRIRASVVRAGDYYLSLIERQGYRLPMWAGTDGHYPWGSNSFVANNAIVLALAHAFTGDAKYLEGVVQAMDYLLGRNPLGLSYVSGYGEHAFENPHHRFWAHGKVSRFPPPPPGALAGGPNSSLQDPTVKKLLRGCPVLACYVDHIEAWSVNEVAINWNAPLSWVAAYLDEQGARGSVVERGEQ